MNHSNFARCGHASQSGQRFNRHFNGGFRRPKYNVPINVLEKTDAYEVHVYAHGFSKENISISVSDDLMLISGTRELKDGNEPHFSLQEFPVKSFERSLVLNGKVDTEKITATQHEGLLIVQLPKTEDARVKERKVSVN